MDKQPGNTAFAQLRGAFFDLDGTLIDSERVWCLAIQEALRQYGISPVSLEEIAAIEVSRVWKESCLDLEQRWPGRFTRQQIEAITVPYYQKYSREHDLVLHDHLRLLRELHARGMKTAIVSGAAQNRLQSTARELHIEDCVDALIGCESYSRGKPFPDAYTAAVQYFSLAPEECIAFEDAALGVRAAKEAGLACVAYCGNAPMAQDFSQADMVLDNLWKVLPFLSSTQRP